MISKLLSTVVACVALSASALFSQATTPKPVPVALPRQSAGLQSSGLQPEDPNASEEKLEKRADDLRTAKQYIESIEYYRAALVETKSPILYNKLGISELLAERYRSARSDFEHSVRLDAHYAAAYNNLGVLEFTVRNYSKAVKHYERAIRQDPQIATYYCNLGAAYFSKRKWKESIRAYREALALDSDIFARADNGGIAGHVASPEDRAHFSYVLAKLYAQRGLTEPALESLRRAMEDGYDQIRDVYSDPDFAKLRQDPGFRELMASRPVSISERTGSEAMQ
jgi:tetratricopeptide (TPR) repeat protein